LDGLDSPLSQKKKKIFDYQPWFIQLNDQWKNIKAKKWKQHNEKITVKIEGVNDRNQASIYLNKEIFINESKLPVLNEHNHYYWKDIIGCLVINGCGSTLGEVTSIIETGSNDVLVIKDKQSSRKKNIGSFFRRKSYQKSQYFLSSN